MEWRGIGAGGGGGGVKVFGKGEGSGLGIYYARSRGIYYTRANYDRATAVPGKKVKFFGEFFPLWFRLQARSFLVFFFKSRM